MQPEQNRRSSIPASFTWRTLLDGTTSLSLLIASVLVIWTTVSRSRVSSSPGPPPPPSELQSLQGAQVLGNKDAPVAIIEYSDFECSFCAAFARDVLPQIDKKYIKPGQVLFAFQHLPLERIHPFALKAAESAECAGAQGKFWEMQDVLFRNQKQLDPGNLLRLVQEAPFEIDVTKQLECMSQGHTTESVEQDVIKAKALQLVSTPSFLIGKVYPGGVKVTTILQGARPMADFSAAVEALLR